VHQVGFTLHDYIEMYGQRPYFSHVVSFTKPTVKLATAALRNVPYSFSPTVNTKRLSVRKFQLLQY